MDKYAFAKTFITSLSYYGRVDQRLMSEQEIGDKFTQDLKAIKTLVDDRTLDNTDLRVAKNYLMKYATSRNMLIRKVAYDLAVAYEQHILVSSKERQMWQAYYKFKSVGLPRDLNEAEFKLQMENLARDRKSAALSVLQQVVMLKKVILSAARCRDEKCQELALTQKERIKLVAKLDLFAKENVAWGMKPGQGTFEAAVASLREVLEDPLFVSRQ
ncbi:MAG: hypothetical protein HQL17_05140 [Candidatus Omnitrophica bacterium]|nr:hypothetical protein [Candidatus Omnitrophota bacterium]